MSYCCGISADSPAVSAALAVVPHNRLPYVPDDDNRDWMVELLEASGYPERLREAQREVVRLRAQLDALKPVDLEALLREVHERTDHATLDIKVHSRGHVLQPNGTWISWRSPDGLHCRFGDSLEQALRAVLAEVEGEHA